MISATSSSRGRRLDFPCSGVILSGGLNTRFGGREKALIRVRGRRILDHIYDVFHQLFEEIILVTNDPSRYLPWDLTITTDLFARRSSLTGIHAGLFYATNPHIFVTACDTPFLRPELVTRLVGYIDANADAIIPETTAGMEPLCALYARKGLAAVERSLAADRFAIRHAFRKDRIKRISEQQLRQVDPDLRSFFNINTPEDRRRAEHLFP